MYSIRVEYVLSGDSWLLCNAHLPVVFLLCNLLYDNFFREDLVVFWFASVFGSMKPVVLALMVVVVVVLMTPSLAMASEWKKIAKKNK